MAEVSARHAWPRAAWLLAAGLAASLPAAGADADAGWLRSGDTRLRMDLALLNDAGVIRLPVTQWPMPRAALKYALGNAKQHAATNAAVELALERVRARVEESSGAPAFGAALRAGQAGLWRDFDTVGREDAELEGIFSAESGRFSADAHVTAVADADDGRRLRPDGLQVSAHVGNWLVSAHMLERWWGPGHAGSLILSNNARPMPTVMVERAEAREFGSSWLRWLGPWRMSFGISRMEEEREDIDAPLFLAWRVVVMPFHDVELGFTRTAQFCGEQLECNLDVFGNLLAGNDNLGFDATPENEPGNQMAGFDLRWNSPLGNLPYAFYGQYIGEDESSYLPAKYLGQIGLEMWKASPEGDLLQFHVEYTNTTCSGLSRSQPYYDCAYNQGRFNVEGYRYRYRVIGHTTDGDSESFVIGADYSRANGELWSLSARTARLNRDGFEDSDSRNLVSPTRADFASIEAGWRGKLLGQSVSVQMGVQSFEPEGQERDVDVFGFVGLEHQFSP